MVLKKNGFEITVKSMNQFNKFSEHIYIKLNQSIIHFLMKNNKESNKLKEILLFFERLYYI